MCVKTKSMKRIFLTSLLFTLAIQFSVLAQRKVLVEAKAVGANARVATEDLGTLRAEVEANLRKVESLVQRLEPHGLQRE